MKFNRYIIIFGFIFSSLFLAASLSFAGPSAPGVMEKVDDRETGETMTSDTLMVLISKGNQKRRRNIKTIRKEYRKDTKGIIFFVSPADVRNTAYMSFDWDDAAKEDDSWLYLPALGKVKRVAAGDKSSSFMGSDFSYSDINGIKIEDWDYTFVKESYSLEGKDTWVIQGLPKKQARHRVLEETGYLKSIIWVQKDNWVVIKAKYWVQKGKKIKYFKAEEIKNISGIWTPLKLIMVTTSKGKVTHSSILTVSNVQYNLPVKDTYFTTRSMEQGL